MKFLELAYKVLSETQKPMSASEIWDFAESKNYIMELETVGTTPKATLAARLYTAANDKRNKNFDVVGERPKRFFIPAITPASSRDIEQLPAEEIVPKAEGYKEKDLHCVLAYFIRTRMDAFPKTIIHSKSKKREYGEWSHPDMVACYFPRLHWKTDVHALSQMLGDVQLGLFSFEIKQRLSFANLRESFFQAVSNSSWAHEGYLVAVEINEDIDFRDELERLSRAFNIGVIKLNLQNPDETEVILLAGDNEFIDWETVNKLAAMNTDFGEFVTRVKNDVQSKEVREEWFDELLEAEEIIRKFKDLGVHK